MLRIENLEVSYAGLRAVRRLNLHVEEGEAVGLIGPNGAGKSTTLNAVAGVIPFAAGEVFLDDQRIGRQQPEAIASLGIALVPEGRRIFGRLTVEQNLRLGATVRRDDTVEDDLDGMLKRFPALDRYRRGAAGRLSGGEQQQLAIARALMSKPRLLLLDEPSLGLAPKLVDEIFDLVSELRSQGRTILLVEQNARRTLGVADRTYVVQGGNLMLETTRDRADIAEVERSYLGVTDRAVAGAKAR